MSIRVSVKLFASLARYSPGCPPGTPFEMDITEPSNLQHLINKLGIPGEEAKVAFVNGLIKEMDWVLQAGDVVGIFPPIGGG